MNPRIAKDIRAVVPSFGLILVAALVPGFLWPEDPVGPMQVAFGFASVLMAANVLGHDVRPGTLALLLAQPLSRGRLWREKMQVLGAALAAGLGVLFLGALLVRPSERSPREFWLVAGLITLIAFCTTPYWTLLYRNTLMAIVLTGAVPALLLGLNAFVQEKWIRRSAVAEESAVILVVYCAALGWLGWRRFRNLQLVDAPLLHMQRELSLPPALEGLLRRPLGKLAARWRGPLATLFKKELRLQLICFVAAGFFCLSAAAGAVLEPLQRGRAVNWGEVVLMLSFGFYVPLLPLLAGAICVAEEKVWGVADWQLTLPVSLRCQWWIKVGTTLITSLALGFFLPLACHWVGVEFFQHRNSDAPVPVSQLLSMALCQLLMTSLAILAGTIAGNTSRALALATGLVFGAVFLFQAGVRLVALASDHLGEFADTLQIARMVIGEYMVWLVIAEVLILLAAIHGLAYRGYRARGLARELFTFRTLAFPITAALFALLVLVFIAAGT